MAGTSEQAPSQKRCCRGDESQPRDYFMHRSFRPHPPNNDLSHEMFKNIKVCTTVAYCRGSWGVNSICMALVAAPSLAPWSGAPPPSLSRAYPAVSWLQWEGFRVDTPPGGFETTGPPDSRPIPRRSPPRGEWSQTCIWSGSPGGNDGCSVNSRGPRLASCGLFANV
jgi:hypothetical protein